MSSGDPMLKHREKSLSGAGRHEVPSEAAYKINMSFDAQSIDLHYAKDGDSIGRVLHGEKSIFLRIPPFAVPSRCEHFARGIEAIRAILTKLAMLDMPPRHGSPRGRISIHRLVSRTEMSAKDGPT